MARHPVQALGMTPRRAALLLAITALSALAPAAASAATRITLPPSGLGRMGDQMGMAIALLGDTALVGAPFTYVSPAYSQGTALIYRNGAGGWQLEAQLTAAQASADMGFGQATALGPDLAVVGAYDSLTTFERLGSTWTQVDSMQATIIAPQIGLSGDTLAAAGVVYVRSGSGWQIQAELQPLAGDVYRLDNMAIDGDFVVAAGTSSDQHQHAVYFFSRSGGTWTNGGLVELGTSVFPVDVAISGNTALVSFAQYLGPASVRIFERDANGAWNDHGVLDAGTDLSWELSVAIEGDVAAVGWRGTGAYTFVRSGGAWTRVLHFLDPDSTLCFVTVALSGSTFLTGCPNTVAPSGGIGTAKIFSLDADPPPVVAEFDQGDAHPNAKFGFGVALSDSALVAQSVLDTSVYAMQNGTWTQQTSIPLSAAPTGAVTIDEHTFAAGFTGLVEIYADSGQGWTEQASIRGEPIGISELGATVALRGDVLAAGDPSPYPTAPGVCHMYERSGTSWGESQALVPADSAPDDQFCAALAMDQDTVIAGAPNADSGIETDAGAAYVFVRSGQAWAQSARLLAPLVAADAHFGTSIAVSGDVAIISALNSEGTRGAAYVFRRNGSAWTVEVPLQDLVAGGVSGKFGYRVAVSASGDKVFVAAPSGAQGRPADGVVYVFSYDGAHWTQTLALEGSPPFEVTSGDGFGMALSAFGDTFAIGAPNDGLNGAVYQGSAAATIFADGFDATP